MYNIISVFHATQILNHIALSASHFTDRFIELYRTISLQVKADVFFLM